MGNVCFICGKKLADKDVIQNYFIPVSICKEFGVCRVNSSANKVQICKKCEKLKGKRIMFPPMHHTSADNEYKLQCVQALFYKLVRHVLDRYDSMIKEEGYTTETIPNYSTYWSRWNHDYKRIGTKNETASLFDKSKIFISTDLSGIKDVNSK